MNRFQHDNIDPSITRQRRDMALKPTMFSNKRKGRKPTGHDLYAGVRLARRRRAFHITQASLPTSDQNSITCPGSMNRRHFK